MKKLVLALVFIGAISCQQEKIAFVDNVKLMDTYQEKVDIEAKFKTRSDAFGKKRDSISQAFQIEIMVIDLQPLTGVGAVTDTEPHFF